MKNLNRVTLLGNLTEAPTAKVLPTGTNVASFTVATNSSWMSGKMKEKQTAAEFHPIVAWGKLAEIASQYLKKGDKVYVEGRLTTRSWIGKDKQKRYRTEVVCDNMIMLGRSAKATATATKE